MAVQNSLPIDHRKASLATVLKRWYAQNRRDLPWRPPLGKSRPVDPYAVLISEFMLQQTQVATVVAYFRRFIKAFPTLKALAAASEQDVLRLWQGLGYYSRARICFPPPSESRLNSEAGYPAVSTNTYASRHRPLHGGCHRVHRIRSPGGNS